jgi:hypothetical protein
MSKTVKIPPGQQRPRWPAHIRVADLPKITRPFAPSVDAAKAGPLGSGRGPYANFRILSRKDCGTDLLVGTTWVDPHLDLGEYGNGVAGKQGYGPADYLYYVIRGGLRVVCSRDGQESVTFDLKADEAIYLAQGWTYAITNPCAEPAYILYVMTPPEI